MDRIAIVGAGVAGAGVAYALQGMVQDTEVSVFERTSTVGGRTATHSRHGCCYDPGANYIKSDDGAVAECITDTLETGLIDIDEPVWTFTADGTISPGDAPDEHKWTWESGIDQLPLRLFGRSDATIVRNTQVHTIIREKQHWSLIGDSGIDLGNYEMLVLTPPAPQSAALLEDLQWEQSLCETLHAAVGAIEYRSIYSVVLHYPFELEVPYYALVNTDRAHDIGWVSREECKAPHVPDGECLLVVQMAPEWSTRRIEDTTSDPADIALGVAERTAELLDDDRLVSPDWTATHEWPNALPDDSPGFGPETDVRRRAERHGLYFAGDWVAGEGRVHLALNCGLAVGNRIGSRQPP